MRKADELVHGVMLSDKKYEVVVAHEIDRAEALHNAGLEGVSRDVITSLDGGECRYCGKTWEKVDVNNMYAKYTYYRPGCSCYPKCRKVIKMLRKHERQEYGYVDLGCGHTLHEEFDGARWAEGEKYFVRCGNCGTKIDVTGKVMAIKEARR